MNDDKIAVYIHIPFCKSKCAYCDFNSYQGKEYLQEAYFKALKREMTGFLCHAEKKIITSVFFGGGTPSYVDYVYITDVLEYLFSNFRIDENVEISIEANPKTVDLKKLLAYKSSGINRLSIGLQSFDDELLKKLGRVHNSEDFLKTLELSHKVGFDNINADLIFGLPMQTMKHWKHTVKNILRQEITHISCYSLKIEEGTPFFDMLQNKEIILPDDELEREMYYLSKKEFEIAGFKHYEISNFAKDGYECKHNIVYWKCRPYIGFGAGAHSYFDGERFNNVHNIEQYIEGITKNGTAKENVQKISQDEAQKEFMMLGFRLVDGISCSEFDRRFHKNIFIQYEKEITELIDKGLINIEGDFIRLSQKGLDFANEVFMEFV